MNSGNKNKKLNSSNSFNSSSGGGFLQKTLNQFPFLFSQNSLNSDNRDSDLKPDNLHNNSNNSSDEHNKSNEQIRSTSKPTSPSKPSSPSKPNSPLHLKSATQKKERFKLRKIISLSLSPNSSQHNSFAISKSEDIESSIYSPILSPIPSGNCMKNANSNSPTNTNFNNNLKSINEDNNNSTISIAKYTNNHGHKKLPNQSASLNLATANNQLLSPVTQNPLIFTFEPNAEHTIVKNASNNSETIISSFSSKPKLFTSGTLIGNSFDTTTTFNKAPRNYKEQMKRLNVRRKSSTLNGSSCFASTNLASSTLLACDRNLANYIKCKNSNEKLNKSNDRKDIRMSPLDEKLMTKAAKRGSIHYFDASKNNANFREILLKLQKKQQEFDNASSSLLSVGINRRKKAFAAVDNSSDYEYEDEENSFNDDEANNNYNNIKETKKFGLDKMPPRLSHAISSLVSYIIFNDFELV